MEKLAYYVEKIFLFLLILVVSTIFLSILFESEGLEKIFSHERLLTITTMALAGLTCWLVFATRELSEIDKSPWLFIDTLELLPYIPDYNFMQLQIVLRNVGKVPVFYKIEQPIKSQMNGTNIRLLPAVNTGTEVYQGGVGRYYIGELYCPTDIRNQEGILELKITYWRSDTGKHKKTINKKYILTLASPRPDIRNFHWHETFSID